MGNSKSSFTAEQVLAPDGHFADLRGMNAIITGANSGIGKEAALQLARTGASIVLGCRDQSKGEAAAEEIRSATGNKAVVYMNLDLGSLESFVREFDRADQPLHLLVLNAGVMAPPDRRVTADGFELQFGTNHLGHFLLATLLLPRLRQGAPSRVVVVASEAHKWCPRGGIQFDDINFEKNYSPWAAYGQSKCANILFASEFDRRYSKEGVSAYSLHPGVIATELQRDMVGGAAFNFLAKPFSKSIPQGAATTVYCAVSGGLKGGAYYANCDIATPASILQAPALAKRLWEASEELTRLRGPAAAAEAKL